MSDFNRIVNLLNIYFDALYECDAEKLGNVLHEKALYACIENGSLLTRTMQEYLPIVRQRVSPLSKGERRRDRVVSIDITGATAAMAKCSDIR